MPLAVYVLGLGIFSMTTSEFMVSGLMPSLSAEFGVSVAAVGYLISAYAAAMVVGGPVLTVGLLRIPPKGALLILVGVFLAGQTLGALAPDYEVMMAARIITASRHRRPSGCRSPSARRSPAPRNAAGRPRSCSAG